MDDILTRGVETVLPSKQVLADRLEKGSIKLYFGIDPTAPSLHLGHLASLLKVRDFQQAGHEVVVMFGDFTARIGDPTNKDAVRKVLSQQEVEANLYYLSLFVTLSMPDICGAIESKNGEASGKKYEDWFNQYVAPKYNGVLSGADCYMFRCSLLHQGRSQHPKGNYSRIFFIEPSATTNIFHNNIMNNALNIDVRIFCRDIIDGVSQWLLEVQGTESYKTNYDKFMRRYPNGLKPYIVGVPVVGWYIYNMI